MKITVTTDDIASGRKNNGKLCPVGLSLLRSLGQDSGVWVDERYIRVGTMFYRPSARLRMFVRRFDNGWPVQPGTFIVKPDGT